LTKAIEVQTHSFVTDEGLRLAASVAGDPEAPAVVLLHGGGQTRHAWAGALRRLAGAGYHAISIDLRGHGDSAWSPGGDYHPENFARDLASVLRQLEKPTALVGASMGGAAAIRAMANHDTENVAALVLVDIVPKPARDGVRKVTAFMMRNLDGFATLDEVADAVAAYNPNRPRPSDVNGLRKNLREGADGRFYWHWDPKILSMGDSEEKLDEMESGTAAAMEKIAAPCLLVRGGESDVVDVAVMEDFKRRLRHLEVCEVSGAGHMVAGDRNDAFNDGVIAFLERRLPLTRREATDKT